MTILGEIIFYGIALVLLIPAVVFFAECLAAILPSRRVSSAFQVPRPRIAVIVPAHNESAIITTCLRSVQPQLEERDQLVVIADNCGDDTAAVARRCGAMVIERREPGFHGKGYALD